LINKLPVLGANVIAAACVPVQFVGNLHREVYSMALLIRDP